MPLIDEKEEYRIGVDPSTGRGAFIQLPPGYIRDRETEPTKHEVTEHDRQELEAYVRGWFYRKAEEQEQAWQRRLDREEDSDYAPPAETDCHQVLCQCGRITFYGNSTTPRGPACEYLPFNHGATLLDRQDFVTTADPLTPPSLILSFIVRDPILDSLTGDRTAAEWLAGQLQDFDDEDEYEDGCPECGEELGRGAADCRACVSIHFEIVDPDQLSYIERIAHEAMPQPGASPVVVTVTAFKVEPMLEGRHFAPERSVGEVLRDIEDRQYRNLAATEQLKEELNAAADRARQKHIEEETPL